LAFSNVTCLKFAIPETISDKKREFTSFLTMLAHLFRGGANRKKDVEKRLFAGVKISTPSCSERRTKQFF
jgi:hypothetical protein